MKESIDNLQQSYELSRQTIAGVVNPLHVAALFEQEHVAYVLIGGHMLSYYTGVSRATIDVDFIIKNADFAKATRLIQKNYAQLSLSDKVYHVTFNVQDTVTAEPERIDLVKDGFALFREIVNHSSLTRRSGEYTVRIPTREAAMALKFAASISPNRGDENKPVDNADLIRLIKTAADIDNKALQHLGELVYLGGGSELIAVVADVLAGKPVNL